MTVDGWTDDRVALKERGGKLLRETTQLVRADTDRFLEQIAAVFDQRVRHSFRYLSELTQLRCGPDLLALNVFPNAKEVSESFGAFRAAREQLHDYGFPLGDPRITCVCVGDGVSPRTGATFAFRSAWNCFSVDPALRSKWQTARKSVDRLEVIPGRIECQGFTSDRVVVVAVHSHARLEAALRTIRANRVAVIAIPCCVDQVLPWAPDLEYEDFGILSPRRTVKVWRNIEASDLKELHDGS